MTSNCRLCNRVQSFINAPDERLIFNFNHSILISGDHHFYEGYSVLISKIHAKEIHHLTPNQQNGIWKELMLVSRAIELAYSPLKLNLASLGNQDPHCHWHIFPRYGDDPSHKDHPWTLAQHFNEWPTTTESTQLMRLKILPHIKSLLESQID